MSNQDRRSEGATEKIGGKLKKGIGQVVGSERLAAEGRAQELRGEAREEDAKAAERSRGKVEEVSGAIKNRAGAVLGNERMQAEGRAKELRGEERQRSNK